MNNPQSLYFVYLSWLFIFMYMFIFIHFYPRPNMSKKLIQYSHIRKCTQKYITDLLSSLEAMDKEVNTYGIFFRQIPEFEDLKGPLRSAQICIRKNLDMVLSQFDYEVYKYEIRAAKLHLLDNMRNLKHNLRFYIDSLFYRVSDIIMRYPRLKLLKKETVCLVPEPPSLTLLCQRACLTQMRVKLAEMLEWKVSGAAPEMEQLLKGMANPYLGSKLHDIRGWHLPCR